MRSKKIFLILTLAAVLIWGYNAYVLKEGISGSDKLPDEKGAEKEDAKIKDKAYVFDAGVRDPFRPPQYKKPVVKKKLRKKKKVEKVIAPPLSIEGVLWDPKSPTATLKNRTNGNIKIVERGMVWDGIRIMEVTDSTVKVKYKGKIFEYK